MLAPELYTAAERHVPLELLKNQEVRKTSGGQEAVLTQDISRAVGLSDEERREHIEHAERVALHFRELLQLGRNDILESTGSRIYHEIGTDGEEIPRHSALTFRPVVKTADGEVRKLDVIWVDAEHRAPNPLTEEDITFMGHVAVGKDLLDGGWYSHRLSDRAVTPRDVRYAADLAPVIPLRPGVDREAAFGQAVVGLAGTA